MSVVAAVTLACGTPHVASRRTPTAATPTVVPPSQGAREVDSVVARQVENLRAFARVYGYVRWFHPSDEASEVDWSALAIYGAGAVRDATDAAALRDALEGVFLPVAPTLRFYGEGEPAPDLARLTPADPRGLVTVAWQHFGPGGRGVPAPYLSKRTERADEYAMGELPGEFAAVYRGIDPALVRGQRLRLRGAARLAAFGDDDDARLWIRVDPPGRFGETKDMGDRPIRQVAWAVHEVVADIPVDAENIAFGVRIDGVGPAMFDDLELATIAADGTATPLPLTNAGFEAGLDDWRTMTKNHEIVADASAARTAARGLRIHKRLARQKAEERLFPTAPAIGEATDAAIGQGLRVQVPLALPSRDGRTLGASSRWPALRAALAADRERRPLAYSSLNHPDLRAADVLIAWNMLQHFYPYFDIVPVDWDAALTTALTASVTAPGELEFLHALQRLVAALDDGHGRVLSRMLTDEPGILPLRFDWVEGAVAVVATAAPGVLRGDVVEMVDGVPAAQWLAERESRVSGSPQARRAVALQEAANGPMGAAIELALRRGDERVTAALVYGDKYAPWDSYGPPIDRKDDGVYVIDLGRADWASISKLLPELVEAPAVVFDIRYYAIDTHVMLEHMLAAPDLRITNEIAEIVRPDHAPTTWRRDTWGLGSKTPKFTGKLVWLIGPGTQSYLETIMGTVEHYHLGEIVGSPSSGANGNVRHIYLPGGVEVMFTGFRAIRHDGGQFHGVGVRPTVPVERTLAGVREGLDEVLLRGLEVARAR